jgi:two-component system cell cycle response regulator DivK
VKILLVDENDMNRDMLSRRLARRGYEVLLAIDGASALSLASMHAPDVVLMDMSMPVMDGWETTRRMKADASTATIRIIALTAHAMAADRERALAAGCDDFDTKPVDLERLIAKIDAVTAGRNA